MKRYCLLLVVLFPLFGFTQTTEDSLLAQLDHLEESYHDNIYLKLSNIFQDTDPIKSLHYARKHLENTLEYHDIKKQAKAYRVLGVCLYYKNSFDSAEFILNKAKRMADSINYIDELVTIIGNLGIINSKKNNYIKSVEYYLEFINLSQSQNNPILLASGYNNLGLIYYRIGDIKTALEFYLKCIKTKQDNNIQQGLLTNYNNLGLCYIRLKEFNKAFEAFQYTINNSKENNTIQIANAYYGVGNSYNGQNDKEKAIKNYNIAINFSLNTFNYRTLANSYYQISSIYYKNNILDSALIYANKCIKIYETNKLPLTPEPFNLLSCIYENKGDIEKALKFKNQFIHLKDSLLSDKAFAEVKNLLSEHQLSETEKIIQSKNILIQRNRHFLYMLAIIIILLLIILHFAYRNIMIRKKLNDKLSNLVHQRTQDLNSFFYRISHDLAGPIATIKGLLKLMTLDIYKNEIESFLSRMDSTNQRLEEIINKLNTVSKINSKTINYENIDIEALVSNILDDINSDSNNQIDIHFSGKKTFRSDRILIHTIFRNILINSFQHKDHRESKHKVTVDINNNGNLLVKISDNGKGIELKYTPKIFDLFYVANDKACGNGLGLYQAKLAVQRLKGEIRLLNNKKPVTFEVFLQKPRNRIVHLSNDTLLN